MDDKILRLRRESASGDEEAIERLLIAKRRAGLLPKPKRFRRLTGRGSILEKAARSIISKHGAVDVTADRYLIFCAAIAKKHGTEFGAYCLKEYAHIRNGNVTAICRVGRAAFANPTTFGSQNELVRTFLAHLRDSVL